MVETLGVSSRGRDSQKRILIVPNERAFRGLLRDFVQSLGCLCAEADSVPRALDLLRKTHLPIVVSDSVRPEMDGLELLQIIKKRYPDVDVLIITGHESDYP
jgi:DNA-binding NtrC family response regulator